MGLNDTFIWGGYQSDNGTTYAIKISTQEASAGGFSPVAPPPASVAWPWNTKSLRHVWGVDNAGHRTRIKCFSPGFVRYVNGGQFNIGGRTYTVTGAIGECRRSSELGG